MTFGRGSVVDLESGGVMGKVDLDFRPSVPVFDANVALGRRTDRRVRVDTVGGALKAMDQAGIEKALVYSPHAALIDSTTGNNMLMEMIRGEDRLVPQLVFNPASDDLDSFAGNVADTGVRSVRMFPKQHTYPLRDWLIGPSFEWLAREGIPLWMDVPQFDPAELHDTLVRHPDVTVVLSEVHYSHVPWALPFVRSLGNTCVEISRLVIADGIARLMDAIGPGRILYGSWFPDTPMAPQLYNLHHCGLDTEDLCAICSGNLVRLLGKE